LPFQWCGPILEASLLTVDAMLTTAEVVAMLRECMDADSACVLSSQEVRQLVERLDALEAAEAELTELRASLETRSPED